MQSLPSAAVATTLVGFGAACCAAGLWMLFHAAARIAAGPVLLLAGLGLLAVPWFAAQPPGAPAEPPPLALSPVALSADGRRTVAGPVASAKPPPLPGREAVRIAIEAAEAEPNDTLAAANAASTGTAIVGALTAGDLDHFAVDVPPGSRGDIVAGLVVLTGDAGLTIFDEAGRPLGSADTSARLGVRTTVLERLIEGPRYYVLVRGVPTGAPATYQLTLTTTRR